MTSTASQASPHLPISLAFNGLERGLIFMPSLSIRHLLFFSESFVRNYDNYLNFPAGPKTPLFNLDGIC